MSADAIVGWMLLIYIALGFMSGAVVYDDYTQKSEEDKQMYADLGINIGKVVLFSIIFWPGVVRRFCIIKWGKK